MLWALPAQYQVPFTYRSLTLSPPAQERYRLSSCVEQRIALRLANKYSSGSFSVSLYGLCAISDLALIVREHARSYLCRSSCFGCRSILTHNSQRTEYYISIFTIAENCISLSLQDNRSMYAGLAITPCCPCM